MNSIVYLLVSFRLTGEGDLRDTMKSKQNQDQTETEIQTTFNQNLARIAVGAYDDAQDVRTAMMNRVRDIVRKKNEGIAFDEKEEEKDNKDYDKKYKDENLPDLIDKMLDEDKLTDREHKYLENMLEAGKTGDKLENQYKDVMAIVKKEPIYKEWLQHVKGVSTVLTARLIQKFSYCEDFDRVSNLWSYSGMAPGQKRKKGEQSHFDVKAKTLAWLVADRIIMQGDRSYYKTNFYDPYKEKQIRRMDMAEDMTEKQLEKKKWTPPKSQGHAHNRAVRYLAKKFLKHYWAIARDIKGLELPDEWVVTHGGHEKSTDTFENPFYAKRSVVSR